MEVRRQDGLGQGAGDGTWVIGPLYSVAKQQHTVRACVCGHCPVCMHKQTCAPLVHPARGLPRHHQGGINRPRPSLPHVPPFVCIVLDRCSRSTSLSARHVPPTCTFSCPLAGCIPSVRPLGPFLDPSPRSRRACGQAQTRPSMAAAMPCPCPAMSLPRRAPATPRPRSALTLGCTPSSTYGFASLRNSPARMTTDVVPSPTCAGQPRKRRHERRMLQAQDGALVGHPATRPRGSLFRASSR